MRRRWKWLSLPIVAAILLAGAFAVVTQQRRSGPKKPQPIPTGDYTYAAELAEHRLQQIMKRHHIPGMSAALIVDQKIAWQASYGLANIDHEIPVTEDTVFKMWSLAKPFTAVETMRLVEEGLVDLDAPITEYIPKLALQSRFPAGEPITIRNILTHRSGLPRNNCVHETDWYMDSDALERVARSLENCFLTFPTGSRFNYSNVGFDLLGYIVQDKRGKLFPPYMSEQLFGPSGMTDSAFWSDELPPGSRLSEAGQAIGYEYFGGVHYAYEQYDIATIPSSNLYATAHDLAGFVRFIFRGEETGGKQIISPDTLTAMFTEQDGRPADPQPMGLGWKISPALESEKIVWHDGGPSEGIGSLIAMLPERKLGVVLLANATSFEGSLSMPIAIELLEVMLETEVGHLAAEPAVQESYPVETAVMARYQGDYAAFGQIMRVRLAGDQLQGSIEGMSIDLVPLNENRFRVSHWLVELGLADLLQLPMDLGELEIEFQLGAEPDQDVMIVNFGDISYEIFPRYPDLPGGLETWERLAGAYERYERLPSGNAGLEVLGENEIMIVDGRLHMAGSIGPIVPIDGNTIIILSGPFAGETITYDPNTENLYHQGFVYKPI